MKNHIRPTSIVLCLLWLCSCQYAGETTVNEVEDVGPPISAEVVGSGETTLAMPLPFAGSESQVAKQVRNGALLAQEMLSDGKLILAIENGTNPDYKSLTNLALVAAYAPNGKLASPPPKKAITINIGERPLQKDGFSLVASDLDSLAAGLRYAAPSGARVVILSPESVSDGELQELAKSTGGNVEIVTYKSGATSKELVELLSNAGEFAAVGFIESDRKVPEVAAALKQKKVTPLVVGHTGWGTSLVQDPKLEGAIIARPDSSSHAVIAQRYEAKFGGAPTEMSLYGFDVAAVASGLVRQHGKNGITRKRLMTPQGFKGATGAFRFRKDGTVERLYEIDKIVAGKLKVIQSAPAGF